MLKGEEEIKNAKLVAIENKNQKRRYDIHLEHPEFTCHCPMTGYPDFATIYVDYVPDKKILELKSFKLYINKYRDEYTYHEDVINKILDDMVEALDPWRIEVKGDFNVRGNVKTVIKAKHSKE